MRFTTLSFLLFFIAVFVLFWTLRGRARFVLLIVSSLVFYAAWSVAFAVHFFLLACLNHILISRLFVSRSRPLLFLILGIDFANLFFFKYFYLFLTALLDVTGLPIFRTDQFNGWLEQAFGVDSITLPLAISFYTFQMGAFAVDAYRGQIETQVSFTRFAVFVLFFPHTVAGPIMRHSDFFWQLDNVRPDEDQMLSACYLLCLGLFKKVVIADNTITAIGLVYDNPARFDAPSGILAVIGYSLRVYCDFSGYTDIARGLGKLMGIDLPENFRGPFLSRSVREFWQRWHITLSTWLRDYLFIPMGGSRAGFTRTQLNLVLTFTLGGLWHGANYTYITWGFLCGFSLALERVIGAFWSRLSGGNAARAGAPAKQRSPLVAFGIATLATLYAYGMFCFGMIFFNARDMATALALLKQIALFGSGEVSPHNGYLAGLIPLVFLLNAMQTRDVWHGLARRTRYILSTVLAFLTVLLLASFAPGANDFIYFQF